MLSLPSDHSSAPSSSAAIARAEDAAREVRRKCVVARGHGRVRREDALPRHRLDVGDRRRPLLAAEPALEERQDEQRRVAFVDVMLERHAGIQLGQQRGAAHA